MSNTEEKIDLEAIKQQDTAVWADHFREPHTGALYRQDVRGNWYDLEGVCLTMPVFLRGDVLVSLPGRASKKSFAFRDRNLYVSPNKRMIQIGRMVLDVNLEHLRYFGDRLASLGTEHVNLGDDDCWQEVLMGLDRRGFLNEYDSRPLLMNGEEITGHLTTVRLGGRRYDVWESASRSYVTQAGSEDLFRVDDSPVALDFDTYVRFKDNELVLARAGNHVAPHTVGGAESGGQQTKPGGYYINLTTRAAFRAPSLGDVPILELIALDGPRDDLFRVRTPQSTFVFDAQKSDVFAIDGGELLPQHIRLHPDFPNYLLIATVNGKEVICDRLTQTTLAVGPDHIRVKKITGRKGERLLAAIGERDEALVLDTVAGMSSLTLAQVDGRAIVETVGSPFRLGGRVLQHCMLRQTGSPVPRVVVISDDELPLFTLPWDMVAYDDQPIPSSFAGAPILRVILDAAIDVMGNFFFPATFLSYANAEEDVLLQAANGRPLHLDGEGHRNELVTTLVPGTLNAGHKLGDHRMLGARTLTHGYQRGELMFSAENHRSWLSFYDGFLPIFRRVVSFDPGAANYHFVLYELRETGGTGEYVAVEKEPPHRILVTKLDGRYFPKIITNKDRNLANPEQISALKSFLISAGELVEVL